METIEMGNKEIFDQWHNDPSNWTVNFANPYSYLTLLGIIILFLVIVFYI